MGFDINYDMLNAHDEGPTRIFKGKVDPKWIKESEKYQKYSANELKNYIKSHPGRFAKGAAIATTGVGLVGTGSYMIGKELRNKNKK